MIHVTNHLGFAILTACGLKMGLCLLNHHNKYGAAAISLVLAQYSRTPVKPGSFFFSVCHPGFQHRDIVLPLLLHLFNPFSDVIFPGREIRRLDLLTELLQVT